MGALVLASRGPVSFLLTFKPPTGAPSKSERNEIFMKKKTDVEKYIAEEARSWKDRQNDEAFAKADKKACEKKARELIGVLDDGLSSMGFSENKRRQILQSSFPPCLIAMGFTRGEVQSLSASYFEQLGEKPA